MIEYQIILFKNKNKKKLLKKYSSKKKSVEKYFDLINNNNVKFEVMYENGIKSDYEIALVCVNCDEDLELFSTDSIGRNILIESDDNNVKFLKISNYLIEEKIQDYQQKKKITIDSLCSTYLKDTNLKNIFTLNNKLFIQNNEIINCFVTKNEYDSIRLLNTLEYMMSESGKGFISMQYKSSSDKKYIYNILEDYGFDKKFLYRKVINHQKK